MPTAMVYAASATVKGGFWEVNNVPTLTGLTGRGFNRRRAAHAISRLPAYQEMLTTLNGATPAVAALKTVTRIANSAELSGVRAIETVTVLDANSAAGDITRADADFFTGIQSTMASPANLDGNPLGTR